MLTKRELYRYTGNISQVFYAKQYCLTEGRGAAVFYGVTSNA